MNGSPFALGSFCAGCTAPCVVGKSREAVWPTTYARPAESDAIEKPVSLLVPPRKVEYCKVPVRGLSMDMNATPLATLPAGGIDPTVCGKFADEVVPVM